MTSAPWVAPVYLAVPSHRPGEPAATMPPRGVIARVVDRLAKYPATVEKIMLAVGEYSAFLHELSPLGAPLESAARVRVFGFDGTSYTALFDGLAQLLEYDRYRLTQQQVRAGRPVVVIIVHCAPEPTDDWRDSHAVLIGTGQPEGVAPTLAVLATTAEAVPFALEASHPSRTPDQTVDAERVAERAAAVVIAACDRPGVGDRFRDHDSSDPRKGIQP